MIKVTPEIASELITAPKCGIYTGCAFETYKAIPAVNASVLKPYRHSARKGLYEQSKPSESKPHFDLGAAVHTLALEGEDVFNARFIVGGPINEKTGKSYGATSQKYMEWHSEQVVQGLTPISDEQAKQAKAIAQSIKSHIELSTLLSSSPASMREVAIVFVHKSGVLCKALIDALIVDGDDLHIFDLKTMARDLTYRNVQNVINDLAYHMQFAFYQGALSNASNRLNIDVYMGVVCSTSDHDCALFKIDDATLVQGSADIDLAMSRYKACQGLNYLDVEGSFPTEAAIGLPAWAISDSEQSTGDSDDASLDYILSN